MKKILFLLAILFLCTGGIAYAQNLTKIPAVNIQEATGTTISSESLRFEGSDQNGSLIAHRRGGSQRFIRTVCAHLNNGAIGASQIPNPTNRVPVNIRYHNYVTDTQGSRVLLAASTYLCNQGSGCTKPYTFDSFKSFSSRSCFADGVLIATRPAATPEAKRQQRLTGADRGSVTFGTSPNVAPYISSTGIDGSGLAQAIDTQKAAISAGLQYACSTGNDANDGLSIGTAKQHIYDALQTLPNGSTGIAGNGSILICDQTAYGGPVFNQGVWLMGGGDPNYSSPPPGWLKSVGGIYFGCYSRPEAANNGHTSGCRFNGGDPTNHAKPSIWISGFGGFAANITFDGWQNAGTPAESIRLGINSNGNRSDGSGGAVGLTFENGSFRVDPFNAADGPVVNIGANVYWLYFKDNVFQGNAGFSSIPPTADAASTVLVNAAGGNGNQLIFMDHNISNDGSVKMYAAANGLGEISVNDLSCEVVKEACLWFPTGIVSGEARNVLVADPVGGSSLVAAVENDGLPGNLSVSGGIGGFTTNYLGPMQIDDAGGYPSFTVQGQTQSPASMGQTGTVNGHVVGKVDNVDRANPPSVVRYQTTANQNPSTVSFCTGGAITTGIDDPYGGTNALRASCTRGSGQVRIYDANFSLSVGQAFVWKSWVRSHTANGYDSSAPMEFDLEGTGSPTLKSGNHFQNTSTYLFGTSEWQVVTGVGVVTSAGTGTVKTILWFNVDSTHTIDFYAPMFFSVPNTVPMNELYEIANNLTFYPDICAVAQVCNMSGPVFGQTIKATSGCIGCSLSGSATLTYAAITARTCQERVLNVTGAKMSDVASASPVGSLGSANLSWSARVSSADRVSVRVCNPTSGSLTPTAVAWQARVIP